MLKFFSKDIGIDLGTSNTLIYQKGRGIVINQPSLAAVSVKTGSIIAVGDEAKKMLSRTPPHIQVVKPLAHGVISDFEATREMLRHFLRSTGGGFFKVSRAVIGVPSNLTEVERKSVEDVAIGAGVSRAYLIEEVVAATLGAGLPIEEPTSNMIIDMGGGTTDIAIISMGGAVVSKTLKIAGDQFNQDIINYIREEFKLVIGEPTAEELKIGAGSAIPLDEKLEISIRGRDIATGLPRELHVRSNQVRQALGRSLRQIVDSAKEVIEMAPPELVGDIFKNGIHLTGGMAQLRGLDVLLGRELVVAVKMVPEPTICTAKGIGMIIENFEQYEKFLENPQYPKPISI